MRVLALIVSLSLFVSGCQTFMDMTNRRSIEREEKERQAKLNAENERIALINLKSGVLQPGTARASFESVWGEPSSRDYLDGIYYSYYQNDNEPLYVIFKNDKIVGWKYDVEGKERAKARVEQKRIMLETQIQEAKQAEAQAWQNLGQSLQQMTPQRTSCVSRKGYNGQIYTDCTGN